MGTSGEGTTEASSQRSKNNEGAAVSLRKLSANRQNGLKSTGPKTPRGKAFSRRNASKHGLLARQMSDFGAHGEDPWEYSELLEGLREQYQPVGRAEELEVERISQSWWRLKRAHRYENAVNRVAQRDIRRRETAEQEKYCKKLEEQEKAAIQILQSAEEEIEAAGEIPQGLKERVSAAMPGFEVMWPACERIAEGLMNEAVQSRTVPKLSAKRRAPILAQVTAGVAVRWLESLARTRSASVQEIAVAQHVIPNGNDLDKLLRYEAAIDRNLGRALDRLERLQRRRRREDGPDL